VGAADAPEHLERPLKVHAVVALQLLEAPFERVGGDGGSSSIGQ
jgi:hypothetical protein